MANTDKLLIADIGSTTTKAILFERQGDRYRLLDTQSASTTVEKPHEDVTHGLLESIRKLEKSTSTSLLSGDDTPDLSDSASFLATSSAGGGLQILVSGLSEFVTARTARRAASIAGGIILDVLAVDDDRTVHQKINAMNDLRPDVILISGGLEGGDTVNVLRNASVILAAAPKPKFMSRKAMPLVYAGNSDAAQQVRQLLEKEFEVTVVDNLRPSMDEENIEPTRKAIHELFITNVMKRAPGYNRVLDWTGDNILPTPSAVERILEVYSREHSVNTVMFDIGGATTDVFSHVDGRYSRTVSANLGMSYSASNVLQETGYGNIARWLPEGYFERDVRNRIMNKCINPTTIPNTDTDLAVEQAVAREALRLAFDSHLEYTQKVEKTSFWDRVREHFTERFGMVDEYKETHYIQRDNVDLVIGAGGVLSRAPKREHALEMLIDAVQTTGLTFYGVDSVFMSPHLGMMCGFDESAALKTFENECFIPLGSVIALSGKLDDEGVVATFRTEGSTTKQKIYGGNLKVIPAKFDESITVIINPVRGVDAGEGSGSEARQVCRGGEVGIVIDARGRPLENGPAARMTRQQ